MAKTTAATRLTRAILYSLCMENEAEVLEYIRSKYRADEVYRRPVSSEPEPESK